MTDPQNDTIDLDDPLPHVDDAIVDKWDREWMLYLSTESKRPHLIRASELTVAMELRGKSRSEVFDSRLTKFASSGELNTELHVWALGDELIGTNVVEIGCGTGFLGKQLGLVSAHYLGIDISAIAIAIARGNSPQTCEYLQLGEREAIMANAGRFDTMVGREFFIHQNFTNARWVLATGRMLLRDGGVICADFYQPNPQVPQGVIHPARSPLDPNYASCAFVFSQEEIDELAAELRLDVVSIDDRLDVQRRFVVFRKR